MDSLSASPSAPAPHTQTAENRTTDSVSHDFETLFLGRFVDEMMKTVGPAVFGGEQQADMWRSFLSDAVAQQLAETNSLSLGGTISRAVAAYGAAQSRSSS